MEYYAIKFASIISENRSQIAFVFNEGTNLEHVSHWMLEKYKDKGFLKAIRFGESKHFFFVEVDDYTFTKAYKLRLLIENDMFDDLHAIRVSITDVRKSWIDQPKTNIARPGQARNLLDPNATEFESTRVITINPQQIAWDKLASMVQEAKEKTGITDDVTAG